MLVRSFCSRRTIALFFILAAAFPFASHAQSSRPGVGAIPYADSGGTGVTFRVWAPNASSVKVKGQFNGWAAQALTSEGSSGYWSRDIPGAHVGQEYKYVINNSSDKRDPRSRRVTNSAGNSIIYDPYAFDWGGVGNVTPYYNDMVIYEMHAGTYNAESWVPSTFDQCIEKLDHLKNLGINAIEVMPPFEFAGDKSWGYNPADPYAIESALGGADAFKRFVKAAHERGMAVLVDVVHNHYGPSDLALWQFDGWSQNGKGGIYFYNDYRSSTLWGETRPDYGRTEVRDFIRDNIRMLLDECRVDGFRWDSVFSMLYASGGSSFLPDGSSLLYQINTLMATGYPGRIRIAEDHAFDNNIGFDAQWDVNFHDDLKWQVTRNSDADRNMQWLGDRISAWASLNHVIYSESHDTTGALNGKHRLPRDIDPASPSGIWARKRQLLAESIVMTSPGIPMIFQGQEMNEDWDFAAETALRWSLTNTWSGIVRAYTDLISARRNKLGGTQGLKGTGINVYHKDDVNKVIAYVRWDQGGQVDDVVVVANFASKTWTNDSYQVQFPSAGTWYAWFNGDSSNYGADFGNIGHASVVASGSPPKAYVNMGMYSALIYSKTAPPVAGAATLDPALPNGCVPVTIMYNPGAGDLAAATSIVASVGVNGWQNSLDLVLTNDASNVWYGAYDIPLETVTLDYAFHSEGTNNVVWDNNLGNDWHTAVANCANLPSVATVTPPLPQGCVPVVISYGENSGSLKDSSNIVLFIGRNSWQDIHEYPMAEGPAGTWMYTNATPSDTWQLDFVFHNTASNVVWDNHNGADWHVIVSECVDPLVPVVTITNPTSDIVVSNETSDWTVRGITGPGIVGQLVWTNLKTEQGGDLPVAGAWSIPTVALGEGANLIRVTGTNAALNPNAASHDAATDTVYTTAGAWTTGQDGGEGWGGGWQLNATANAGQFLANVAYDTNLDIGVRAWGLWANNGGLSSAVRPLAGNLNVGDVLHVKFENHYIDFASSVGIGLQNRFGQNLLEFLFVGGDTNYVVNDGSTGHNTGLPFNEHGLDIEFELTSPTTYRLQANALVVTGTLAVTSETVINRFRTWNYQAGGGPDHNVYLTDLRIDGIPELESSTYQDEVTITRNFGPFSDQDQDGFLNWEEEFAGTDPYSAASHLPDIGAMSAGQTGQVDIPSTEPAHYYDLFVRTNLLTGGWLRFGLEAQGSGGPLTLSFTNLWGSAYYRTGVYQP